MYYVADNGVDVFVGTSLDELQVYINSYYQDDFDLNCQEDCQIKIWQVRDEAKKIRPLWIAKDFTIQEASNYLFS